MFHGLAELTLKIYHHTANEAGEGRAPAYSGMLRPAGTGTAFYGYHCEAVDSGAEPRLQVGNRHLLSAA